MSSGSAKLEVATSEMPSKNALHLRWEFLANERQREAVLVVVVVVVWEVVGVGLVGFDGEKQMNLGSCWESSVVGAVGQSREAIISSPLPLP